MTGLPFDAQYADLCTPVGREGRCTWDHHWRNDPDHICCDRNSEGAVRSVTAGKRPKHKGWRRRPLAVRPQGNAGILVGEEYGLLPIEVDGPEEQAEYESWGLPPTFTVRSGKGYHYYFLWPRGRRVPGRYRKILLRVAGHMVAPGSTHWTGATYTVLLHREPADLPGWFLDKLEAETGRVDAVAGETRAVRPGGRSEARRRFCRFVGRCHEQGLSLEETIRLVEGKGDLVDWLESEGRDIARETEKWWEKVGGNATPTLGPASGGKGNPNPGPACAVCGAPLEGRRKGVLTCSSACRKRRQRTSGGVASGAVSVTCEVGVTLTGDVTLTGKTAGQGPAAQNCKPPPPLIKTLVVPSSPKEEKGLAYGGDCQGGVASVTPPPPAECPDCRRSTFGWFLCDAHVAQVPPYLGPIAPQAQEA